MNECYEDRKFDLSSPAESTDSGIQMSIEQKTLTSDENATLPSGWERFEDEQGIYYWHKQTGTVTRERPELIVESPSLTFSSSSSSNDTCCELNSLLSKSESNYSIKNIEETTEQRRFHVRSLGWTVISEEDLTPERSSRSVNRCIHELTRGINDSIARWGEGKGLYMDINNIDLLLIDPTEMTVLHKQSIPSIRVWGVGRENSRDFAYVAKDRTTKVYKCHVFRCDNTSARTIANTLRDMCRNLMIERGLLNKTNETGKNDFASNNRSNSPHESIVADPENIQFPKALEESKSSIPCTYLGCMYVEKHGGMDILRPAIEKVSKTVPEDKWLSVVVHISPTSFTICSHNDNKEQLLDCRIRYLSFLGVGQDPTFCGIITHCADNSFKCHVFHCLPSCVELCRNIEAACILRYQKCLDAHPEAAKPVATKGYGAQIKSFIESFWFGNR